MTSPKNVMQAKSTFFKGSDMPPPEVLPDCTVSCPGFRGHLKWRQVVGLELHGTDVLQALMNPLPIVEDLDVLEDLRLRVLSRPIVSLVHQFVLERAEKALHHRVVVAVPPAAHAGEQAMRLQQGPVREACILGTLIR